MDHLELLCIGSNMQGVPCRSRYTADDDYCDTCRLADAGLHAQSILSGFTGVFASLETMKKAGDAAGISVLTADMMDVMQSVRHMSQDSALFNQLRLAL